MKKILIITYYWPPSAGSGVQRWLKFAKYLPEFGYEPHVYTPENPHFKIQDTALQEDISKDIKVIKRPIWEPYALMDIFKRGKASQSQVRNVQGSSNKLFSWIRGNLFIPDPRVHWVKPSFRFLKKYILDNQIDKIITTGPPHSMHLIGLKLKKELDIKWIADFRDPWSKFGDLMNDYRVSPRSFKKYEQLESQVLHAADVVLATSKHMADRLMPFDRTKFQTITNGFDHQEFQGFNDKSGIGDLIIYHAGMIYKERNPSNFWQALDNYFSSHSQNYNEIKIQLVGMMDGTVEESLRNYVELSKHLSLESYKSHKEVVADYEKANILLLMVNNSENALACIPGKFFEYLATHKPIIAVCHPDSEVNAILKDQANALCVTYDEAENEVLGKLTGFLNNFRESQSPSVEKVLQFSRKNLTKDLVRILDELS